MTPPLPKPTPEEFKALVQWGLANGLLTWPEPTPLDTEAKDFSPDLKRHLAEKEAELRKRLDGAEIAGG